MMTVYAPIVSHHMFRRTARKAAYKLNIRENGGENPRYIFRVVNATRGPWRYVVRAVPIT